MPSNGWKQSFYDDESHAAWLKQERERKRVLARQKRAARRAERKGEPDYPERVRACIERWIDAHRRPGGETTLADAVHFIRQYAQREGCAGYDAIQDRGVARMFRLKGLAVVRRGAGMVVVGLFV